MEAARAFAERDLTLSGRTPLDRLRWAFRTALGREPTDKEIGILQALYRKEIAHYDSKPEAAKKLLAIGESTRDPRYNPAELAAWTLVTSTILNMDETITHN